MPRPTATHHATHDEPLTLFRVPELAAVYDRRAILRAREEGRPARQEVDVHIAKVLPRGSLVAATPAAEGVVHTFVYDISGLKRVDLVLRANGKKERTLKMTDNGPYPSQTGAAITGTYYTVQLPVGAGDVRYYIEAEDNKGNVSRSALERVYLA